MAISKNTDNTLIERFRISNFLSLHDVVLPLKPLTVLVGPNGSGKSNIIAAFDLLHEILSCDEYPAESPKSMIHADYIFNRIWAGNSKIETSLHLETKINNKRADYSVGLSPSESNVIFFERLVINDIEVISVENGSGVVQDEDGGNHTDYKSVRPALKSAGAYGNKPVTNKLSIFILNWRGFDFKPGFIRMGSEKPGRIAKIMKDMVEAKYEKIGSAIKSDGRNLHAMLTNWYEHDHKRYESVCTEFSRVFRGKLKMKCHKDEDGFNEIILREGYPSPISFRRNSDGALRMLAYLVLNNQPDTPSLIVIEEPEKSLHPAWLPILKDILEQLSEKTQVIITTHSSRLLDTFSSEALNENLNVLLLHNIPGSGTQIIQLDDIQKDREGLKGWMNEFGMGSAIFDSELLQDIMEA